MEVDKELGEFVGKFKAPVCFLLGLPEDKCTNRDLVIFVDYLVGHKKQDYLVGNTRLGYPYLRELQSLPREKRTNVVLEKITQYFDRSNVNKNAFSPNFLKDAPFSGSFKKALEEWRVTQLRKNFRNLAGSVNRLNIALNNMIILLSSEHKDPVKLRIAAREIKFSVQSCESNLRSGVAMSIAMNIHPQKVWKASNVLYLSRADKMSGSFSRLDKILASHGVRSDLGGFMLKRQARWRDGWRVIFDNHRMNKNKMETDYGTKIA